MDGETQRALARRVLGLREARSGGGAASAAERAELAPAPWPCPVADYTGPDVLARETERLFRGPLLAGLTADLPEPGDWFTLDAAALPLLVVRGSDGAVRAFLNVCRHRGAPVCSGRGRAARRLVCPYHGWSYELSGRLAAPSEAAAFEDLAVERGGLVALPAGEAHGLVYVRPVPGGDPVDVDAALGGAERELAPLGLERWVHVETREARQRMNWKLVVDTFLEAYHVPVLHRGSIAPFFDGSLAVFDPFQRNGRLLAVRRSIAELLDKPESEWTLLPHATILYQLFPNAVLIHQQDHVELWQVFPAENSPDHAAMRVALYAPEPVSSESAARHWKTNLDLLLDVTTGEDFALGERIQRGFHSGAQEAVLFGRNEPGLIHYHRALRAALGVGGEAGCT